MNLHVDELGRVRDELNRFAKSPLTGSSWDLDDGRPNPPPRLYRPSAEGRDRLLELAAGADFLIESDVPGRMAELGLGYDDLAAVNPALVYVSISAFGQDGPKAGYAESDLIVSAAGATVGLGGDVGRAPVRR